jgi:Tat protein secretion system quality control protein TatD with DNase activity
VAGKLAAVYAMSVAEVDKITTENAKEIFKGISESEIIS